MGEPVSVLANVAAVIGLADLACKTTRHLYSLLVNLKDKSRDISDLSSELEGLVKVLSTVQGLCATFEDRVPALNSPTALVAAFDDLADEISKCRRIIDTVQVGLDGIRKQAGSSQAKRIWKALKWVWDKERRLDLCQRLSQQKITVSLALQTVQGQITLSLLGEVKEASREIGDLRTTSTSYLLPVEGTLIQSATATRSNGERLRNLEQSNARNESMLNPHFASLKITQADRSRPYFTLEMQNLRAVVHPLLNLQPSLQKILSQMTHGETMDISRTDAEWLREEFESLLKAGHSAASEPCNERGDSAPPNWQLPDDNGAEPGRKRSCPLDFDCDQLAYHRKRHEAPIFVTAKRYNTRVGGLSMKVNRSYDGKHFRVSFTFTPHEGMLHMSRIGFVATLQKASHQLAVGRYLSTFTTVEWKGSGFEIIYTGDLQELQRLFMTGKAKPSDRLAKDSNTLIGYAAYTGKLDMCDFLMKIEGVDPCESDNEGMNALRLFLDGLRENPYYTNDAPRREQILRSFVNRGCLDDESWETRDAEDSCLHLDLGDHCPYPADELAKFVSVLIHSGAGREIRDRWGRTPLLENLAISGVAGLAVLKELLRSGVDTCVTDHNGDGALHHAIMGARNTSIAPRNHCLRERLVLLMEDGCDTSLKNELGYTPSDFALISDLWPIWYFAVESTGYYTMDDVLGRDEILKSREEYSRGKRASRKNASKLLQDEILDRGDLSPSPEPEAPVHHCNCSIAGNCFVDWRPDFSLPRFHGIPWCVECGGYFFPRELDQRKREALKIYRERCKRET